MFLPEIGASGGESSGFNDMGVEFLFDSLIGLFKAIPVNSFETFQLTEKFLGFWAEIFPGDEEAGAIEFGA